jgi:hypothetical protein
MVNAHFMGIARMCVRANDRQLVRAFRDLGQLIANLNARNDGANRLELALDAVGRLRLHVERVLLRRAAPQIHQNARLGFARASCIRGLRLRREQPGERQPAQSNLP